VRRAGVRGRRGLERLVPQEHAEVGCISQDDAPSPDAARTDSIGQADRLRSRNSQGPAGASEAAGCRAPIRVAPEDDKCMPPRGGVISMLGRTVSSVNEVVQLEGTGQPARDRR